MKKRSITLHDIAQKAGVSIMTVSRVLRGAKGASPEVRTNILTLAQRMGYTPYRSLYEMERCKSSMLVGVVIPHLANTIFPQVIQELEMILSANGFRILLCCNNNDPEVELQNITAILESEPMGII